MKVPRRKYKGFMGYRGESYICKNGRIKLYRENGFSCPRLSEDIFPGEWPLHGYLKRLSTHELIFRLGDYIIAPWTGVRDGKLPKNRTPFGMQPKITDGEIIYFNQIVWQWPDDIIPKQENPVMVRLKWIDVRTMDGVYNGLVFRNGDGEIVFRCGTLQENCGALGTRSTIVFGAAKGYEERIPRYKIPTPDAPLPCRYEGASGDAGGDD